MISVFVVEDEARILETTLAMLAEMEVNVLGSASDIDTAFEKITSLAPDLVLLDVEVGSQTSFQLLERIDTIDFKVIFITAHQKYAVDAFKFSAVDFLMKPLSMSALETAIRRTTHAIESQRESLSVLQHNLNHAAHQKIILKTQDKIQIFKLDEIIHCEADLSYTIFYTEQEQVMVSKTLGYYEDLLSNHGFIRIHKSHLVNLKHIRQIRKADGGEVELSNGSWIPIAQRKKEEFLRLFDQQGLH